MKQISFCLTLSLLSFAVSAQKFHADLFAGIANYQGDLQGKRIDFSQSKPAIGLGASYELSNKFILRAGFTYGKIEGNDKKNTTAKDIEFRNLSFRSSITELQLGLEYNLLDLTYRDLSPYAFAGVAVYHFNPYTTTAAGNKVFLKPLSTEGQGLSQYPDRKPYNLTQFAIPFGGGIKYMISDNLQVGLELGLRKLFTDHLDDVSMSYVDSATLFNARGAQAVDLAYRGDEVAGGSLYPGEGAQRGNPKYKDWYYFSGIRISYRLNSNRSGKGLACPAKAHTVY
ncbi:MAG TPA: DUF6089 family protein [Ferruginibacter sp.]|nr:DUF6089 family protein [Ferruginibacter sp.]